jgi:hypothetical protein
MGLDVPPNVRVIVNAPFEEAMNILQYSAFTVLPLSTSTTPCGHVTLVCAMHLGKTVVATASAGIADYMTFVLRYNIFILHVTTVRIRFGACPDA